MLLLLVTCKYIYIRGGRRAWPFPSGRCRRRRRRRDQSCYPSPLLLPRSRPSAAADVESRTGCLDVVFLDRWCAGWPPSHARQVVLWLTSAYVNAHDAEFDPLACRPNAVDRCTYASGGVDPYEAADIDEKRKSIFSKTQFFPIGLKSN